MSDKFCINCAHFYVEEMERFDPVKLTIYKSPGNSLYGLCKLAKMPVNPVTGKTEGRPHQFCSVQRVSDCGPEGKFFQEKS